MATMLKAIALGPHVTIQDRGRYGLMRFGVPNSGAMDIGSLMVANALVGNPPDLAAIEFAHVGGEWEIIGESCRFAVTGGSFDVSINGTWVSAYGSHVLRAGQRLRVTTAFDAVWGYIAVAGGFDLEPQLGSLSTHLRSAVGGWHGRTLLDGDEVPLRSARARDEAERRFRGTYRPTSPIRVVLGPQDDYFTDQAIDTLLGSVFRVTHQGDRMGYRLDGPGLEHARGYNIISDAPVPGCIQVPGSGQPIVLLMDSQTIGGYPKIATIISSDLRRFAQCRPGAPVTFQAVDVMKAQRLLRADRAWLDVVPDQVESVRLR